MKDTVAETDDGDDTSLVSPEDIVGIHKAKTCPNASLTRGSLFDLIAGIYDAATFEFYRYNVGPCRHMCTKYMNWLCPTLQGDLNTIDTLTIMRLGDKTSAELNNHKQKSNAIRAVAHKASELLAAVAKSDKGTRMERAQATSHLGTILFMCETLVYEHEHSSDHKGIFITYSSIHGAHQEALRALLNSSEEKDAAQRAKQTLFEAISYLPEYRAAYEANQFHIHPEAAKYDLECTTRQVQEMMNVCAKSRPQIAHLLNQLYHGLNDILKSVHPVKRPFLARQYYLKCVHKYTAPKGFAEDEAALEKWYSHLVDEEKKLSRELSSLGLTQPTNIPSPQECNWSCGLTSKELKSELQKDVDATLQVAASEACRYSSNITDWECRVKLGASYTDHVTDPFDERSLSDGPQYHMPCPTQPHGSFIISRPQILRRVLNPADLWVILAHECSPGHHVQVCSAMQNARFPDFKRYRLLGFIKSFSEGWGLYAEQYASSNCFASFLQGKVLGRESNVTARALKIAVLKALRLRYQRAITDILLHFYRMPVGEAAAKYQMDDIYIRRMLSVPGQVCSYVAGYENIQQVVQYICNKLISAGMSRQQALVKAHDFILLLGETPMDELRRAAEIMFC